MRERERERKRGRESERERKSEREREREGYKQNYRCIGKMHSNNTLITGGHKVPVVIVCLIF